MCPPVRFRSSPLRGWPAGAGPSGLGVMKPVPPEDGRVRTAAVFGGNSDIAVAIVRALAAQGLKRAVLAVRDPHSAPGAEALRSETTLDVATIAFDADATDTHPRAVDAVFEALAASDVDVAVVAFGVLSDEDAKHDPAAAVRLAHTNFTGA